MEDGVLKAKSMNLVIGGFNLNISNSLSNYRFDLPNEGMAFIQPLKNANSDIEFVMKNKEKINNGKLLFGSLEHTTPTFVYGNNNGEKDWIIVNKKEQNLLSFHISSDWKIITLYDDKTDSDGYYAFHEFGYIFSYAILNHHAAVFHGVVMEYEGKGILVMASSGTGKTTHTRMWRDYENALILNGDRCLVRKIDDTWYAYGMPWAGSSGEYINRRVPITCIVALERDTYNHVETMTLFDQTLYLMQRIFAPAWPGELQNKGFDICEEIVCEIPVIQMYCTPDKESVNVLKEYILRNF